MCKHVCVCGANEWKAISEQLKTHEALAPVPRLEKRDDVGLEKVGNKKKIRCLSVGVCVTEAELPLHKPHRLSVNGGGLRVYPNPPLSAFIHTSS